MLMSRVPVTAIFGACLFAFGCGASPLDGGDEDVAVSADPILWANGDGPFFFWSAFTQGALLRLGAQPLIDSAGQLTSTPLLGTPEGREVLRYVVGCAVSPGTTVLTSLPGITFDGAIGLAVDWQKAPLADVSSQRWVTACLLQTLNGLGLHVPIVMVGGAKALANDPLVDVSGFTYLDATMFGNIFLPPVPGVRNAFACIDQNAADRCGKGTSSYAQKRICDSSPTCGLELLLPSCSDWCAFDNDGSARCQTPAGEIYAETITTFLTEDGYRDSYSACDGLDTSGRTSDTSGRTRR